MPRFLSRILVVMFVVLSALGSVIATQLVLAAPTLAQTAAPPPEVCNWLDCKTAAVSYSQDDTNNIDPNSANSCHDELVNAGLRGTFNYNGSTSPAWLVTLSNEGHEIGSHLTDHGLNCAALPSCYPNCTPESLLQIPYTITDVNDFRQTQIDPNVTAIESRTNKPVLSMAWTCGNTDAGRMAAAEYYFVGTRGYTNVETNNFAWIYDVNTPTPATFMNLNSDWYFHQSLLDKAIAEGGWQIVTVHDYCEGVTQLKNISDTVWVAPIGEVLKYIRVRDATQFSNYVRSGYNIYFDAVHTLGTFQREQLDGTPLLPIVFDNPVTIRTPIASSTNVITVQRNGIGITYTEGTISGTKYVWFNTPLTVTQHVTIVLDAPTAVSVTNLRTGATAPDALPALMAAAAAGLGAFVAWQRRRQS